MAIKSFKNKGLEELFITGSVKGVNPKHASKLLMILDAINSSHHPKHLKSIYRHKFQEKKGGGKGVYSIEVNGNWRVTFQIDDDGAILTDYLDYHGKQIKAVK